ncbi:MAG: hypothetical protein Q7S10_03685 [bacterium]|nr:hypothetical protein [bacterium]
MEVDMFFSKFVLISLLMAVMILDWLLTIIFQPECYWEDHSNPDEINPVGIMVLRAHPVLFIVLFFFYFLLILALATRLRRPFNMVVIIAALGGHTWGSSSWLHHIYSGRLEMEHWCVNLGYYTFIVLIAGVCITNIHKSECAAKFFAED